MTKLPKNRFFSLCATSRSWRCCRYGDSPSSLARSAQREGGSVQPPASAPPTVSSVGLSGPIRLTATPHLCSVPGSAMGLSVHLKIICCSSLLCVFLHRFDHVSSFCSYLHMTSTHKISDRLGSEGAITIHTVSSTALRQSQSGYSPL